MSIYPLKSESAVRGVFSKPEPLRFTLENFVDELTMRYGHANELEIVFQRPVRTEGPTPREVLPKRVLRNGPALVCFWDNGDKVVVKCSNEEFDAEKGLAMAVLRHLGVKRSWVKKAISGIEEQEG